MTIPSVARSAGRWLPLLALPALIAPPSAARDCASVARIEQQINVSSGVYSERAVATVPLEIRLPMSTDTALEAECLRIEGRGPMAAMTAEFERVDRCRAAARRLRLAPSTTTGAPRLGRNVDDAAYEACLRGDVEVEVLDGD